MKWFVDTRVKIFHVNFIGYSHWFMYISISQLKEHSISVDQDIYATYAVENYLDTAKIKENSKFHKTTLPHGMVFTKEDASNSDEKLEVISIHFNIQYKACVLS